MCIYTRKSMEMNGAFIHKVKVTTVTFLHVFSIQCDVLHKHSVYICYPNI